MCLVLLSYLNYILLIPPSGLRCKRTRLQAEQVAKRGNLDRIDTQGTCCLVRPCSDGNLCDRAFVVTSVAVITKNLSVVPVGNFYKSGRWIAMLTDGGVGAGETMNKRVMKIWRQGIVCYGCDA